MRSFVLRTSWSCSSGVGSGVASMSSLWFIPDAERWRAEESYNPAVPAALDCVARKLLQDGGAASDLLECVAPIIDAGMSQSQRLRVLYVVCLCLSAEDPP